MLSSKDSLTMTRIQISTKESGEADDKKAAEISDYKEHSFKISVLQKAGVEVFVCFVLFFIGAGGLFFVFLFCLAVVFFVVVGKDLRLGISVLLHHSGTNSGISFVEKYYR